MNSRRDRPEAARAAIAFKVGKDSTSIYKGEVIGAEATLFQTLGDQDLSITAGAFAPAPVS